MTQSPPVTPLHRLAALQFLLDSQPPSHHLIPIDEVRHALTGDRSGPRMVSLPEAHVKWLYGVRMAAEVAVASYANPSAALHALGQQLAAEPKAAS